MKKPRFLCSITACIIFLFCCLVHSETIKKPKVRLGEYTVYYKEKYHIFKVQEFGKLKLSENCFSNLKNFKNIENEKDSVKSAKPKKSNHLKPNCQAYEVAQIKVSDIVQKKGDGTHPASLHCARMMGENLIAYDHENSEYDFCRFPDDSLVSSWSMFYNSYKGVKK